MYTTSSISKHTTSLSPNQFLRPQRDHSPSNINRQQQSHKHKYYSTQQVSKLIKSYIQPRILYLKNQLEQKNKVIQSLNQKLDQNDDKLTNLYNYAENITRKLKQYQQQLLQKQQNSTVQIVNQLINDKLKQYWQTVNGQIDRIKQHYQEQTRVDEKLTQDKIQYELVNIRKQTMEYIDQSRVKNNSYWLKIKQALNRINSKIGKVDEMLVGAVQQHEGNQQLIKQHLQHFQQMRNSKQLVKKLIELKKSVQNIYENYSNLLQLQNMFKNRLDEVGKIQRKVGGGMIGQKNQVTGGGFFDDDEDDFGRQSKKSDKQFLDVNCGGNTFPMFRKKPPAHNQQQFSIPFKQHPLQPTYSAVGQQFNPHSNNYKENDAIVRHLTDENFVLEYSRDENGSDLFGSNQGSAVVIGMKPQQQSGNQYNIKEKYLVPTYSKNKSGSSNQANPTYQLSPIKSTPSQTSKLQHNLHYPTDLSCLNSSVNALRPGAASRSTSFVNLSLQNRNQMSESVKQRLQQIIELKNLPKPLMVYVDEINYLKNGQGNYIFDTRGNMFKVNMEEGRELEKMGIVQFIDKSGSGSKRRENNSNNHQLLDKLTIPESISYNKSINSMTKIKSIALSKTQI